MILKRLEEEKDRHRVVLDIRDKRIGSWGPRNLVSWAEDSVGDWKAGSRSIDDTLAIDKHYYVYMPSYKHVHPDIITKLIMCKTFLWPSAGNRTCFEKCM